jgi:predicted branched-subunit amino acid permease
MEILFVMSLIAISAWLIMRSNYQEIERKYRVDFWIGIGTATWTVSIIGTILGFYLSEYLNKDMLMGLAILNPIYFICMMVGAMKTIQIILSVSLGCFTWTNFLFFFP